MQSVEHKIWNSFIQRIKDLPQSSPVPHLLYSYFQKNIERRELNFVLDKSSLRFNGKILDLTKRYKVYQIFELFILQDHVRVHRNTFIKHVYPEFKRYCSYRQLFCYNHNIVKIISRARKLATKTFRDENETAFLNWLPYDPCSKTWRLYSVKED